MAKKVKTLGFTEKSDPKIIKRINAITKAKTKEDKRMDRTPSMPRAVAREAMLIGTDVMLAQYGVKVVK